MPNIITDNTAKIVGIVRALIIFAAAFWPGLFTPEQQAAIIGLAVVALGLTGVTNATTVPKTPSSASSSILQTPPSGTVLVTTAAAAAPGPVPAGDVVASSTTMPPQP